MATNWQPPFGLSFGFPPQTPQQQRQAQTANGQQHAPEATSDPYQTPAAEPFANPWSAIPGLNMQSYGQNTQQPPPYPPAAWRPPLPLPTPDAWNQAMQMQFPFLQNGAFPPPPFAGFPFPAPPFPQTPTQNAAPVPGLSPAAQPFQPAHQPALAVNDRISEMLDSDKEDGEVSEGDRASQPPAVNGSAYRGPPRSAPQSMARQDGPVWKGHRERYNPEQPAAGHSVQPLTPQEKGPAAPASPASGIAQQREEAKQFVKLLHSNNIGYRALAAEDLDPAPLRELYRSLNLPSEPEPVPPPRAPTAAPASSKPVGPLTNTNGTNPIPVVTTNIAIAQPAKSAPSPVDRQDYIARLQAVRKGKQAAAAKATSPQTTPPAGADPSAVSTSQSKAGDSRSRQTELIKQRLVALTTNPPSPVSSSQPSANGAAPAMGASSPATRADSSANTPTTPFPGIPGLFLNSPSTALPLQPAPNPRKRPLASIPVNPITPSKPSESGAVNAASPAMTPTNPDRLGQSTNLPSRPASAKPARSAASTPAAQTPGSQARAEEMSQGEKALAAARIKVKQKMMEQRAERERLKEVTKVAPTLQHPPTTQSLAGATVAETRDSIPPTNDGDGSTREAKRMRREKLESDLAAAEAREAAAKAEIVEAENALARLRAHDEQMQQNKAKLIRELEELGIDTDGMPHNDLQAKKAEIEREQRAASVLAASSGPSTTNQTFADKNHVGASMMPETLPHELGQARNVPVQFTGIPGLAGVSVLSLAMPDVHKSQPRLTEVKQVSAPIKAATEKNADLTEAATPKDSDEDFYSPKPAEEPSMVGQPVQATPPSEPKSPSEDGEIAMSESEDEYEPDEPESAVPSMARQDDAVERRSMTSSSTSSLSTDDEEMYEPPDVDFPISDAQPRDQTVDLDEDVPQGEVDDGAMDISSSDDSDNSDSVAQSPRKDIGDSIVSNSGAEQSVGIAASQPDAEPPVTGEHDVMAQAEVDPWAFVPYQSPLRQFKSYRYHPSYMQDVSGGFMSMTYSHQIDAEKTMCPTETNGASCNDDQCQFQHFHGMNLNGEKLLVQLGTANPGKTPEERQQWNDGLREVLKTLRQKNTKDPNGIAIEIAEYRRRFLNDPTRVVNL